MHTETVSPVAQVKISFLDFEEWKIQNEDICKDLKDDCYNCDGSGRCRCADCGDEHECSICGGTGIIAGLSSRDIYERQLKEDKERLAKYLLRFTQPATNDRPIASQAAVTVNEEGKA